MKKNNSTTLNMVATKNKSKALSCSTPERQLESPSRDSDSLCDSEAGSPVPFLCTQDGAEGETDVVWNFYTPKSEHGAASRLKNSTPLSRRTKKTMKSTVIEKPLPKRRTHKTTQKRNELFQDLIELNQNLHELIAKKPKVILEKRQSGSEDDIFSDSGDSSPKTGFRTNSRCLRRNVLSSKFSKPEIDTAMESDDSMNECLIKASQIVEEKILNQEPTEAKRPCLENVISRPAMKPSLNFEMDHDSMDAILHSIKLDSPLVNKVKKCDSPHLNNDSFDSIIGNLNDSVLERLTQMPTNNSVNRSKQNASSADWTVQELIVHDSSPSSKFGRHNSMPESPSVTDTNKPSTSGMVFGRYNSMPYNKNSNATYSPTRCSQEEIKKKHQQAREKLLAKRLLPFTQQSSQVLPTQQNQAEKKTQFQPRFAGSTIQRHNSIKNASGAPQANNSTIANSKSNIPQKMDKSADLKLLIEKKRQEALMKLRKRQPQRP